MYYRWLRAAKRLTQRTYVRKLVKRLYSLKQIGINMKKPRKTTNQFWLAIRRRNVLESWYTLHRTMNRTYKFRLNIFPDCYWQQRTSSDFLNGNMRSVRFECQIAVRATSGIRVRKMFQTSDAFRFSIKSIWIRIGLRIDNIFGINLFFVFQTVKSYTARAYKKSKLRVKPLLNIVSVFGVSRLASNCMFCFFKRSFFTIHFSLRWNQHSRKAFEILDVEKHATDVKSKAIRRRL